MNSCINKFELVVIGASAGGMTVVKQLITSLPLDFDLAVILVQHIGENSDGFWPDLLNNVSKVNVKEVDEKDIIVPGTVYLAPANYHVLVEKDKTLTLTTDEKVNYARPSIDVLFETAADAYREKLIGIVLTGANSDGAKGLKQIKETKGLTIVQDPLTAESKTMPQSAINLVAPDYIFSIDQISVFLSNLNNNKI